MLLNSVPRLQQHCMASGIGGLLFVVEHCHMQIENEIREYSTTYKTCS